jgi:hypothetical protein
VGCAGSAPAKSSTAKDRVFYEETETVGPGAPTVETAFPRLDAPETAPLPPYLGVSLFGGGVHFSRPRNWRIRSAGTVPGRRYVVYFSPHAYLFAIYERGAFSPGAWHDEIASYEDEAPKSGGSLVRRAVPMAVANAQGRSYVVRQPVAAAKGPLVNVCHEYLLRGDHQMALLQIVAHEDKFDGVSDELRRVVDTLEVQ